MNITRFVSAIAVVVLAVSLSPAPLRAQPLDAQDAIAHARNAVYPALINIRVVQKQFDGGRMVLAAAGGSGVIVSADGYALTNFHVAGHSTFITCTTQSGANYGARVVLDDPETDLSVLKLIPPAGSAGFRFPHADLGDSDDLTVGTYVLAMGNPLMLASSMTLGIVSNPHRVFTDFLGSEIVARQLETGEQTGTLTSWIQTDALILPGNSGGPLVDLSGHVIGINELGGNGYGFAIPASIAREVLHDALEYGKVTRGTLDLAVLPVGKLGMSAGALVSAVQPGGAAAKAGVRPGDVVESIDGKPVRIEYFEQVPGFYQVVARLTPGHRAQLALRRAGRTGHATVTVATMQPSTGDERECDPLGCTVSNITTVMAAEMLLSEISGVLVTGEQQGKPLQLAEPTIEPGDVVWAIDGKAVAGIDDFMARAKALQKRLDDGKNAVFSVDRDGAQILAVVKKAPVTPPDLSSEISQAWIGVKTQVLTPDLGNALGIPGQTGLRITEVYGGTKAQAAGLLAGDVITSVDGNQLLSSRPQDAGDLVEAVRDLEPGTSTSLGILRGGKALTIPVTLEENPGTRSQPPTQAFDALGMTTRSIARADIIDNRWPVDQKGVLVTDVVSGGWAYIGGLKVGDVVLSVNGTPVADNSAFTKLISDSVHAKAPEITLFVRRGTSTSYIFIEPDWTMGE